MTNALDLTNAMWRRAMAEMGQPAYRADQIFAWLHKGADFSDMKNLPGGLRETLAETYTARGVVILEKFVSKLDGTVKYLFGLSDGHLIEGVRMRYHHGDTLCLSTQVGCRMGCRFCASTLDGLVRDLTPGEMLGQVIAANLDEPKIHNVVLMGSGEPLDNEENTLAFLRLLREPGGIQLSLRQVSLSTCGIVPAIRRLADSGLPVTLSVSLHAPNDAIRAALMPAARAYPMDELLSACRYYLSRTGRRVIFEYALVSGVNDQTDHAVQLAGMLRGMQCHVNLIPLNPVKERALTGTSRLGAQAFQRALEKERISVSIRREMGRDISGACGQLRRGYMGRESENIAPSGDLASNPCHETKEGNHLP